MVVFNHPTMYTYEKRSAKSFVAVRRHNNLLAVLIGSRDNHLEMITTCDVIISKRGYGILCL